MAEQDDDDDKQNEPSAKKLEDARKKGEVPRSTDLNTAAAYAGLLLAGGALGAASLQQFMDFGAGIIAKADTLAPIFFRDGNVALSGGLLDATGRATWPWFAVPATLVLLSIFAQRSLIFAPSKLEPKLSRISVISNAKNKFGRSGLFEFVKSAVKLFVISAILGVFLSTQIEEIIYSLIYSPGLVTQLFLNLGFEFLAVVAIVSFVIGGVDYMWQYSDHMRKNRMSHKELKDEAKDAEGDPHLKQQRRQRGMEIASNQMLQDVPEASVIIVNPTHFAVALKWDRARGTAPVCVAKGTDEIAARIREIAQEAAIPIHSDPPTARALHASVSIGAEIEEQYYQPVAVAIRFAEDMQAQAQKSYTSRKGSSA
ncbi:flagellar biosynthesis protein FlhB [Actibacterium sp. 188UL27-1]|uniref:EscU/YscU/HrcU family type III secretion system export apparatus switch protein n=1 Tax=Actibacterium sp. 188UL27-1 TaxID=2786961 RepID=UPI0019563E21|nr:flagellar type III secretion system protein FlhB [Actibacterium sp. 188UL27-1]MBM7066214.1 flagellar biosynthesis protein FlhB [Actibacterium sp. 188UL27-1]